MVEIIAAIIGAIVAAIANHLIEKRKRKEIQKEKTEQLEAQKEEFEYQTHESAKSIHKILYQNLGWKAQKLTTKLTVLNKEGDTKIVRNWKGVKISDVESRSRLPGYFWSYPMGSLKSPPVLSLPNRYPKKIDLVVKEINDEKCEYYVDIAGALTKKDPPLDYNISWEQKKSMLLSSKAVKEAYKSDYFKYDYFSFTVGPPPMEKLVIEVDFPVDINVEFYSTVFDGSTEYQVDKEFQRTRNGLEKSQTNARFAIDQPFIGLTYLIYWVFKD